MANRMHLPAADINHEATDGCKANTDVCDGRGALQ